MATDSNRVLFVDLARAAAVVFMIQGHALSVLLAPEHQHGTLFDFWLYLRGLTSCAFLMLAGFSFVLATDRHWDEYRVASPRLRRRLTRFATFWLLGYAMRIPIRPLSLMTHVTPDQWRQFMVVDILQLVAVTLTALQLLAWLTGAPHRLGRWAFAGAAAIVLLTPIAWRVPWSSLVPMFAAGYLSAATGSIFPIFPWAAYILFGAALGAWFVRRAARPVELPLLVAGATMIAAAVLLHRVPLAPYGPIEFWATSPNLFLAKGGSVLVLLSAAACLTRWRRTVPRAVSILSGESLTIYFVHVCILYGSIWNDGLLQRVGPHLGVAATVAWAVALAITMTLLAWAWHECKRRSFGLAALMRVGAAATMVYVIS